MNKIISASVPEEIAHKLDELVVEETKKNPENPATKNKIINKILKKELFKEQI